MRRILRAFLAVVLGFACGGALAAPITLSFSGISHTYWTTDPSNPDSTQSGLRFSGAIVYDAARGETTSLDYAANGSGVSHTALTREGCRSWSNAVCVDDFGGGRPVVLGYRLETPWGVFTQLAGDFYSDSYFALGRDYIVDGDGSDAISIYRHDERQVIDTQTGPETLEYVARQISIGLLDLGANGRLFGDILDLGHLPDLTDVELSDSPTHILFTNASCSIPMGCGDAVPGYGPRFTFLGQFDAAAFRRGVHLVPEPGSIALAGLGLFLLGMFGRRLRQH